MATAPGSATPLTQPRAVEVLTVGRVEVVCGLGAGDAFGASLCHGLLSGWDPLRCVEYGNAAGAIVASRLACSDAMPTVIELDTLVRRTEPVRTEAVGTEAVGTEAVGTEAVGTEPVRGEGSR